MQSGSYVMDVNLNLRVISFNSLYFNTKNRPDNDPIMPNKLMDWLDYQLLLASQESKKAILLYHIPHGTFLSPFGNETFWQYRYEKQFDMLLKKYASTISILITGHTHISFHHFLSDSRGFTYGNLIVNRALSPIFVNNPGFTMYYYDNKYDYPSKFVEYSFLDNNNLADPNWTNLYDSHSDMGMNNLSPKGLSDFTRSLSHNPVKLLKYMMYKLGERPHSEINTNTCLAKVRLVIEQICGHYVEDALYSDLCASELLDRFRYSEQHIEEEFAKYI